VSSMNFFLPLTEETPTPISAKQTASCWGVESRDVNLSFGISCNTFGISILGGLFRFSEEEEVEEETEGFVSVQLVFIVSFTSDKSESLTIVIQRERERERERERF
jgi:hypothetical protein